MSASLSFLFTAVRDDRAGPAATFIGELPRLSGDALVECDLGVRSAGGLVVCLARYRGALPEAVRCRLEFWAWSTGAIIPDEPGGGAAAAALARCDRALLGVPPRLLRVSAMALISALPQASAPVGERLAIRIDLAGSGGAGLSFDTTAATVFLPTPRALPVEDEVALDVLLPGGGAVEGAGMVLQARPAGAQGPGSPAGLLVGLTGGRREILDALEAHADRRRQAPRYVVSAPATLKLRGAAAGAAPAEPEPGDHVVENISQGGAFLRTALWLATGTPVELGLELPGASLSIPAVVVHRDVRGLGVRFETDSDGEAAVARALAEVTARRRRALVVDDDQLGRRMLGDALADRGFEVFASCDGQAGLEMLIERLLDLDVLVTDLRMPGIDGEQLLKTIRVAGGEQDLAIVVVSADVDPSLERRLLAAGADAVLAKAGGSDAVGVAAERAVLRRRCAAARVRPEPPA